jgi:hypothetical protein
MTTFIGNLRINLFSLQVNCYPEIRIIPNTPSSTNIQLSVTMHPYNTSAHIPVLQNNNLFRTRALIGANMNYSGFQQQPQQQLFRNPDRNFVQTTGQTDLPPSYLELQPSKL